MLGDLRVISHGEGFVLRHVSGRYFQSSAHFAYVKRIDGTDSACHDPAHPMKIIFNLVGNPFAADLVRQHEHCGRFLSGREWADVANQFEVVPGPGCACCGTRWGTIWGEPGNCRCDKHRDRNPCVVEGCTRTRAANGQLGTDQTICGEHWRRYVPARSRERRLYHCHFRRAKRMGWNDERIRSFERFWDGLVARVRNRATEGHLDETAINKMFGWPA